MKTRYKIGELKAPVVVMPGDQFNLTLTEFDAYGNSFKQKINEEITISMIVTHWVMFYVQGVGFGGMFGDWDLHAKLSEIFVEPILVDDEDMLMP